MFWLVFMAIIISCLKWTVNRVLHKYFCCEMILP